VADEGIGDGHGFVVAAEDFEEDGAGGGDVEAEEGCGALVDADEVATEVGGGDACAGKTFEEGADVAVEEGAWGGVWEEGGDVGEGEGEDEGAAVEVGGDACGGSSEDGDAGVGAGVEVDDAACALGGAEDDGGAVDEAGCDLRGLFAFGARNQGLTECERFGEGAGRGLDDVHGVSSVGVGGGDRTSGLADFSFCCG